MANHSPVRAADLLDWARWRLGLHTDRALAYVLAMPQPSLSKIRHGLLPVGPNLLVRLLDATDVRLQDLPALIESTATHWSRACRR